MKLRHLAPLLTLALLAGGRAEENPLDALVRDSPFGAASAAAETGTPASGPEFRGYFVEGGEQFFSVYDPASQRARWLRRGEAAGGFAVRDFAADRLVLDINYQGRALSLPLRPAKVLAAAAAPAVPPPAGAPALPAAAPAGPAPAASASDEVRQSEQELALARQRQAYEARRKVVLEKQRQLRAAATGAPK